MKFPVLAGLLVACLICLAAGCKVDQAKEVATYRQIIDAQAAPEPPAPFNRGEPLTLERALLLANHYNERLGLQGEAYLQSLIARDRAAAAFMPTISLNPSLSASQRRGPNGERTTGTVPLNTSMNLFNGFIDINAYRAAARNIEQQKALLLDAQATLLLDVAGVYYQILRNERLVVVLQNSLQVQEERLRDSRARVKAGSGRQLDVSQSEAQLSATRVSLITAQNQVASGRSTLAFLVGASVQSSPLVDDLSVPATFATLAQLQEDALRQRQDIAAAAANIQAARLEVNSAVGQYYPSVTFNLTNILATHNINNENEWNAGLSAHIPLFTGGVIHANVRQAWSFYRQAVLSESQTRRQVLEQVEQAYNDMLSSQKRLAELAIEVRAAEAALFQSEAYFKTGLGTNLERLTAQDQLLNAQLDMASETFDQKLFYLNLLRMTGELNLRTARAAAMPTTRPATLPTTMPAANLETQNPGSKQLLSSNEKSVGRGMRLSFLGIRTSLRFEICDLDFLHPPWLHDPPLDG